MNQSELEVLLLRDTVASEECGGDVNLMHETAIRDIGLIDESSYNFPKLPDIAHRI